MAFSEIAAQRGHEIDLFEGSSEIGGQFNLAKKIPGKEEFYETLRYFYNALKKNNVNLILNKWVNNSDLIGKGYDEVVFSTGVNPRSINIEGINSKNVISYIDAITGKRVIGKKIVIIGAGGIGFDVAELISHGVRNPSVNIEDFAHQWGIDFVNHPRGGVTGIPSLFEKSDREIIMLQRTLFFG